MSDRSPRILVVGPNSAVDRVFRTTGVTVGGVARATWASAYAGGKAANAGNAIALAGGAPTLVGFAGGITGRRFKQLLPYRQIEPALVACEGETRETYCFLDAKGRAPTLVVPEGPEILSPEVAKLRALALRLLQRAEAVVFAGSVPPGCPLDLYAGLIAAARERGVPSVVDCAGPLLAASAKGLPSVLCVNEAEFRGAFGPKRRGAVPLAALVAAARKLVRRGVGAVAIKRGPLGVVFVEGTRAAHVRSPRREGNPTGSGDVVTGLLALALARGVDLLEALPRAVAAAAANLLHEEPAAFTPARVELELQAVRVRPIR